MSEVVGDFVDQNENSRTLAPASVGSQVLLMSGVSVRTHLLSFPSFPSLFLFFLFALQ